MPTTTTMPKEPDKLEIAYAMQKFGSPFTKALSQCVVLADPEDLQRIKDAFPARWEYYSVLADNKRKEKG